METDLRRKEGRKEEAKLIESTFHSKYPLLISLLILSMNE
jgi:hypothetical protein